MRDFESRQVDQIQNAFNTTLSGLQDDPWLAQHIINSAAEKNKTKKKISLAFILAVILIMLTATVLAVSIIGKRTQIKRSDIGSIRECASINDTLYMTTSNGLYEWTPGNEAPRLLSTLNTVDFESIIYSNGNSIGFIDTKHKVIWNYKDGEYKRILNYENTELDKTQIQWKTAVFQDDKLFLKGVPSDGKIGKGVLYCVDIQDGNAKQIPIMDGSVEEICTFESGKILALISYVDQLTEEIVVIDATSGAIESTLFTSSIQYLQGLAYQKESNTLYALAGGVLSYWNGSTWNPLNAAAHTFLARSFAVLNDGYVIVGNDEMQYLPFEKETDDISLKIRGNIAINNIDEDFQNERGITVVRHRDPSLTGKSVREAIENGDDTDLFYLVLDADVIDLMRDGLLVPLENSKILLSDAMKKTPTISNTLFYNDELYAIPSLVLLTCWSSTKYSFQTYEELFSQIEAGNIVVAWEEGEQWAKEDYANVILRDYILECVRNNRKIDFKDEAFKESICKLKEMNLDNILLNQNYERINPMQSIALDGSKENFEKDMPNWAMPPTVLQCVDSIIPGRMYVYVLNCKSENKDIAIDFLSYLVGHRSLEDEGLLDPESAKPVLRQYIQEEIEENEGMGNEEELISSPESWAITENRLLTYKYNILPHMDLQLHPMLSVSSKREGGVYADILKEILNYIDGNEAIEKCLDRIQTLCNSFI